MAVFLNHEQGSVAWHEARRGIVTASRFKDVLAKSRGPFAPYLLELLTQKLTEFDHSIEPFSTPAMAWGNEQEPLARLRYQLETAHNVTETGLALLEENPRIGGSADGLVGNDGLIEIKCPNSQTHLTTLISGLMPEKHVPQVQGLLWILERKWCDFISFDPRITDHDSQFFCVRVYRDEGYINTLSEKVFEFVERLNSLGSEIKEQQ